MEVVKSMDATKMCIKLSGYSFKYTLHWNVYIKLCLLHVENIFNIRMEVVTKSSLHQNVRNFSRAAAS